MAALMMLHRSVAAAISSHYEERHAHHIWLTALANPVFGWLSRKGARHERVSAFNAVHPRTSSDSTL
jgi:hypothetical protein